MDLNKLIKSENATLVDVRESFEFARGHAIGAINIPLGTVPHELSRFKKMSKPIIVYCRSGMRSGQAATFLQSQGIKEVYNGGGLEEVIYYQKSIA